MQVARMEGSAPCNLSTRQELVGSRVLRGRPSCNGSSSISQHHTLQISQSSCLQSPNERGKHSNWSMSLKLHPPHHPDSHPNTPRAENETSAAEPPPMGKASGRHYLKIRLQAPRHPPHRPLPRHLAQLRFHTQHPAPAGRVTRRSRSFLLQKMSHYQLLVRGDGSLPLPIHQLRAKGQGPPWASPDRRPRFGQSAIHYLDGYQNRKASETATPPSRS